MTIHPRIALPFICAAALAACSDNEIKQKEPPAVPVIALTATTQDIPVILQVIGRAEAYENVVLKSRVDGQVAEVLFTDGQHVKKDDALIRLDPADFTARLRQAEAATARDRAMQSQGRADTVRYTALKTRKFISEEKLNEIRTAETAASANLRASKAAEEIARLQLSYSVIRAPFPGMAGARLVFPGSFVKAGETELTAINRIRPLLVSFSLPEKHLPQVRQAMVSGKVKVGISLPENTLSAFEGKIFFIDNAINPATGTILMKAILPNEDEKLSSGQFLNVRLTLDTLANAVVIPNEAVQQGAEGNFVFVIGKDDRVEMRKIDIGTSHAGLTAIVQGLQPGDNVVTDGHLRLAPGTRVRNAAHFPQNAAPPLK
ncbi:MAG: efflux RND transporter periplasmic adaptor subunit [Candidatus Accumulibacter sp.]|jgi:multidrug efflux system membrane fusion protein|nr:efflux RND transporter periplasmic adaptor subunit [Accumulibacter sp.]